MKVLEAIGILKIDILGLKTLSQIEKTLGLIEVHEGVALGMDEIPLEDEKSFELLQKGCTVGVFQLESAGMRDLLRKIKPTVFGDVTAVTLANGMALPKAGVFAEGQALAVARRISEDIRGVDKEAEFDGLGFCWIEMGSGSAGFASGEFYAEPDPVVPLPRSGRIWHWGKIIFEKYWLAEGFSRQVWRSGLIVGSKVLDIPATL